MPTEEKTLRWWELSLGVSLFLLKRHALWREFSFMNATILYKKGKVHSILGRNKKLSLYMLVLTCHWAKQSACSRCIFWGNIFWFWHPSTHSEVGVINYSCFSWLKITATEKETPKFDMKGKSKDIKYDREAVLGTVNSREVYRP